MKSGSISRLICFGVLVILVSCKNPLQEIISSDVAARFPHLVLRWYDGTEITAGDTWDVGGTVTGVFRDIIFSVENEGDGALTLMGETTVTIGGTDADVFSLIVPPATSVLPPGGTTTFTIRLQSTVLGEKTATLTMHSNDADMSDYSITLIGRVTEMPVPDILVRVGSMEIDDSTGIYEFLNAFEGSYENVTFTIENAGSADLILESTPISISGDHNTMFTVHTLPASSTLAVGDSTTFTIRFEPASGAGTKNVTMGIASNDPDENPFAFSLTGTITPEMDIQVEGISIPNTGSHDFTPVEPVVRGTLVDIEFTVSNPGRANLELTGSPDKVVLSGIDEVQFSVISQPVSPVPAMGSTTFTVRYLADKLTLSGASVAVENSDPDESSYSFDISASAKLATVVTRIAAGEGHTVARKANGTVWTWGSNIYGQLGDGTTDPLYTPKQISGLIGIVAVAAGHNHTVALKSDGTVWAWGRNNYGQVGDGTDNNIRQSPVQVPELTDVVAITAGDYFTVALTSTGYVWAWGYGVSGRLGNSSQDNHPTPVQVSSLSGVMAIAAGASHTVALKTSGGLYAWGSDSNGQLGSSSASGFTLWPVPVTGLTDVAIIAAGASHTVAINSDSTVMWAWGANSDGRLGVLYPDNQELPVQVTGITDIAAITAGNAHTVVRKINGELYACGDNDYGQLGDAFPTEQHTLILVSDFTGGGEIATGNFHTLALDSDNTLWMWGNNSYGQLGDGTVTEKHVPVQVSVLPIVGTIAAGGNHSIALKADGALWSWGYNGQGQLGDNSASNRETAVQVMSLIDVTDVATGSSHSVALKEDGTVWTWGLNDWGQLGDGTQTIRYVRIPVSSLSGVGAVATGGKHTFALISGTLWAWGRNDHGQLGISTTNFQYTPAEVSVVTDVGAIEGGDTHSVALNSDGSVVYTWGYNDHGQLGINSTAEQLDPVIVSIPGGASVGAIAAGASHTVAMKSDGSVVWAWGDNTYGQLGDMTNNERLIPTEVSILTSVAAITAGSRHTVALKEDGTVWTWGDNAFGQLGYSFPTGQNTPTQVPGITDITAIAAGAFYTIAVNNDGTVVWVWGLNSYGQLGNGTIDDQHTPVRGGILPLDIN
jgi:alpha-tubulin suppressor-like RCC1 family protein